jgi:CheY-like chemotaxis protein
VTRRKPRILIADDDHVSRETVFYFLKSLGYRVATAPDASRARNMAAGDEFELAIVDAHMIREQTLPRPIKVIVLTRDDSRDDVLGDTDAVNGSVAKPVDLAVLQEIVARLASPPAEPTTGLYRRVLRSGFVPGPAFRRTVALLKSTGSPRIGTPSRSSSSR